MSKEVRRQIKLDLYGIQVGGQPEDMMNVISAYNSCRLDNLKECSTIFQSLNKYISDEYKKQLNENDITTWSIESSKTTPYDKLSIFDDTGKALKFNWTDNYLDSVKLSGLRAQISHKISKEYDNYTIAKDIMPPENCT